MEGEYLANASFRHVHSLRFSPAARCVCATSSPAAASTCASHNRGNSALGNGARSGGRCVQWSTRACRIHARTVLAPAGWAAAPVFHASQLRAWTPPVFEPQAQSFFSMPNGARRPIAAPIVCRRPASVRPLPSIRPDSSAPPPRTGAPPTFLRRAAHSLVALSCSIPS